MPGRTRAQGDVPADASAPCGERAHTVVVDGERTVEGVSETRGREKEEDEVMKDLKCTVPAALYAGVCRGRPDGDLSVDDQLRALRDFARANGYSVAGEYVDEAESVCLFDRPRLMEMIGHGGRSDAPFKVILAWEFSRLTRKRVHAVALRSALRSKGVSIVSIAEQADDSVSVRLHDVFVESVDELYSEMLSENVAGGMRKVASRGFFLGPRAPFGYRRVRVSDGVKGRHTLEVDPATAPLVRKMFERSLRGTGLREICRDLNDRGVTNRGGSWHEGSLYYLLTNEAYTGTAVWGKTARGEKVREPVRVEGAWPALVSRKLFDDVRRAMSDRAPKMRRPARAGGRFLLGGLLKCGVCGAPYAGQGARGGQPAHYVCTTRTGEDAGTCGTGYLDAPGVEDFVVDRIKDRVLTDEVIVELVMLAAEEMDPTAGELAGSLDTIIAELVDVRGQLHGLYGAAETSELAMQEDLPRILYLRHREEQLTAAEEDAASRLERRRAELPDTDEFGEYAAAFRGLLKDGAFPYRGALIRNFIEGIDVKGDEVTLRYMIAMPGDGANFESASLVHLA